MSTVSPESLQFQDTDPYNLTRRTHPLVDPTSEHRVPDTPVPPDLRAPTFFTSVLPLSLPIPSPPFLSSVTQDLLSLPKAPQGPLTRSSLLGRSRLLPPPSSLGSVTRENSVVLGTGGGGGVRTVPSPALYVEPGVFLTRRALAVWGWGGPESNGTVGLK